MSPLVVPTWTWILLGILVVVLIAVDLLAHRGDRVDSRNRAIAWSLAWIGAAVAFGVFVTMYFGAAAGEEYFGAYLLEKSLSIDNLFVFILVFASFGIPHTEQRRVLTWGIVGALVTRALFIGLGAALLHRWHEVTYLFGALLVYGAWKTLASHKTAQSTEPKKLPWPLHYLPWTKRLHGHKFIAKENGRRLGTPLLAALIAIELTDIVFALDSIPAAFAVTDEPFLVYSSNVFAILGLRALYIVLADALSKLRYLHFGLAAVLAFAGAKLLLAPWLSISPLMSVGIIALCIGAAAIASLAPRRRAST